MNDELPREVSRGIINVLGCEIEVVHLDNGQRIITAESLERLFASGIETEGHDPEEGHGAKHESPAPKADAQKE